MSGAERGFAVRSVLHGGVLRPEAVFTCECGAKHRHFLRRDGALNPELAAKRARADGWKADAFRASVAKCPKCQGINRAGDRPGEKVIPMSDKLRDPTSAERLKIRDLLDKHFDDSAGCYLDGYSDQKIGTDLNVPWALVAKIREAGWGPIRVDPEISAIRAEIKRIETAMERHAAGLTAELAALKVRLDKAGEKRAA